LQCRILRKPLRLAAGDLHSVVAARYPLDEIARAHDHVDAGTRGRILLAIPT
jgi:NADPH:quinone reductase